MIRRVAFALLPMFCALACSSTDDNGTSSSGGTDGGTVEPPPKYTPAALPPLADAPTTLTVRLTPKTPQQQYTAGPNPVAPDALQSYLDRGFGEQAEGPGEATYTTRVIDDSTPPAAGPGAKRIVRFVHLADLQIADDESPTRVGQLDAAGFTSSALRPQDAYLCRMGNAAVRTINALHKKDPIAFTIMGGDNADSAQTNEVDWVLGVLSGRPSVECDSGDDDDVIKGGDNDGKDPFVAEGLAMKWLWVTGNHDVLVQGNVAPNESNRVSVVGDSAPNGTRLYSANRSDGLLPGAVTTETVPADKNRALLSPVELLAKVGADKDGHGLDARAKQSGKATYTHDIEGTPFRFLVIDTAHASGGADGVITQRHVDEVIKPALDAAKAENKWVILASHHAQSSLTKEGGALGSVEPDAILPDAWATFIGGYSNVVFSMVGHSHEHRVRAVKPAGAGHAWWEVMTSAIADYPHQFRVVEIYDQDNGWLMLRSHVVDISVQGDPVAAEGRRRGVVDQISGWLPGDGRGKPEDRNVELWIKKP